MNRRTLLTLASGLSLGRFAQSGEIDSPRIRIILNPDMPAESFGEWLGERSFRFPVGLGKHGVTASGKSFQSGFSLLGDFRVNAILSADRFEMENTLIRESGKSEAWLRENLFRNMSSIDFDGDGKGNEYGAAFIGLQPVDSDAVQPFHFGEYQGTFRWYSYAIHGTQNEERIGKCVTGGCVNVGKEKLGELAAQLKLGDRISIRKSGD